MRRGVLLMMLWSSKENVAFFVGLRSLSGSSGDIAAENRAVIVLLREEIQSRSLGMLDSEQTLILAVDIYVKVHKLFKACSLGVCAFS